VVTAMLRVALLALACLALAAADASAQADYPSRPVRIVVNSAPGGGTDILARVLAQHISRTSGQQFFVENRGGAAGQIGIEAVINTPPDGYTLLMTPSTLTVNPAVYKKVRYDPVKDFAPITQVAGISNVLVVHPSVAANTLADFIALAKSKPGQLNYASAGAASSPHMCMELLKHMAGIDLQHIPFKGTGPAVTEVLSGRIAALFSNLLTGKPLIEAGKLRALAVSGGKRVGSVPDVPTVAETVPGYAALQWYGILAPAGTPQPVIDKLHKEFATALRTPEVVERLAQDGAEPVGSTPAEFAAMIKSEMEKWAKVAQAANIQAE
jgi:tripartite-type tricarboxylate transporter receptor subunit TctC